MDLYLNEKYEVIPNKSDLKQNEDKINGIRIPMEGSEEEMFRVFINIYT